MEFRVIPTGFQRRPGLCENTKHSMEGLCDEQSGVRLIRVLIEPTEAGRLPKGRHEFPTFFIPRFDRAIPCRRYGFGTAGLSGGTDAI